MTIKTTSLVQTFTIKRKRLVPSDREISPTESGALKKAEAMAARLPGTAALRVVADDETGELEGVTILGRFGEVPDNIVRSHQTQARLLNFSNPLQSKSYKLQIKYLFMRTLNKRIDHVFVCRPMRCAHY